MVGWSIFVLVLSGVACLCSKLDENILRLFCVCVCETTSLEGGSVRKFWKDN